MIGSCSRNCGCREYSEKLTPEERRSGYARTDMSGHRRPTAMCGMMRGGIFTGRITNAYQPFAEAVHDNHDKQHRHRVYSFTGTQCYFFTLLQSFRNVSQGTTGKVFSHSVQQFRMFTGYDDISPVWHVSCHRIPDFI